MLKDVFLGFIFNTVKYMCVCACKFVWTGLEADCPKGEQVTVTLRVISAPCLDCCLAIM